MHRLWKYWWVKLLALCVLLLACVLAALPLFYRDQARKLIIGAAEEQLTTKLYFEDFSFSIVKNFPELTFSMHNAGLVNTGVFAGDTLVQTNEVQVALNIRELILDHKVKIKELHFKHAKVRLLVDKQNNENFLIVREDSASSDTSAVAFSFKELTAEHTDISFIDHRSKTEMFFGDASIKGDGAFVKDIFDADFKLRTGDFDLKRGNIRWLKNKEVNCKIELALDINKQEIRLKENAIEIEDFDFSLDGLIRWNADSSYVDLKTITRETTVAELMSLVPGIYKRDLQNIKSSGDIQFNAYLHGWYTDSSAAGYGLDLNVEEGMFQYGHLPYPVKHINCKLKAENIDGIAGHTKVEVSTFSFRMHENSARGHLTLSDLIAPQCKGEIVASVDLAELKNFIPIDSMAFSGHLLADVRFDGRYDKEASIFPKTSAAVSVTHGSFKSYRHPEPLEDIHIAATLDNEEGHLSDTRLHLDTMTFTLEQESFTVEGLITEWNDPLFDFSAKGTVDFEKLTKIFPLEHRTLSGKLHADVKGLVRRSDLAQKEYEQINAHGDLLLKNFSYRGEELPAAFLVREAALDVTPERLFVTKLLGNYGSSEFVVNGHLYHYLPWATGQHKILSGDLQVHCDTLVLSEWIFPAGQGSTSATDSAFAIPRDIDFVLDTEVEELDADSIFIKSLKGHITLHDGVLKFKEAGFTAARSSFFIDGYYDTRDPLHPQFDVVMDIRELEIQEAYKAYYRVQAVDPAVQSTNGFVTLKYKLKGELLPDFSPKFSTLLGSGTVTVRDGKIDGTRIFKKVGKISKTEKLNNPEISTISMETEIKQGRIFIKPFSFKVSGFDAIMEGSNDFEGNLNYVLRLSLPHLGKVKIPFHITGPYDDPRVQMFDKK